MWSLIFSFAVVSGHQLLKTRPLERSLQPACSKTEVEECQEAEIDLALIKNGDHIELLDNLLLNVSRREANGVTFKAPGCEAVFAWRDDRVAGSLHTPQGSWRLEGCQGQDCYLWIKHVNRWDNEESVDSVTEGDMETLPNWQENMDKGEQDTTTVVTYSVMIWTTPEFDAAFSSDADKMAFIDLIFQETNQGYINSAMPVRVQLLDVATHPTIKDNPSASSSTMVGSFKNSMPKSELLNCADAAALLIEDNNTGYCGVAYTGVTSYCGAFSVTKRSCATGYYSFGHEIGHNFGAKHNREQYSSHDGDKYGYLIKPTGATKYSGYRTILAYFADGHSERVNHYSNPDVTYSETGTPTGVLDEANNARLITSYRFAMAACGGEEADSACIDCSASPNAWACNPQTAAPTQAPTTSKPKPKYCGLENVKPKVGTKTVGKTKKKTSKMCQDYCKARYAKTANAFRWKSHKKANKRLCWCLKLDIGYKKIKSKVKTASGPTSC